MKQYLRLGHLLVGTAAFQLVVQCLSVVTGLVVLRYLSTKEYGFYTIANLLLGTATILADSGIGGAVLHEAGKCTGNRSELGKVVSTGLRMRSRFGFLVVFVCAPLLCLMLLRNGATAWTALLIGLALVPAFYASLSDTLLEVIPKVRQDLQPLLRNQLMVAGERLLLAAGLLLAAPVAWVAVCINTLPRLHGNLKLRALNAKYADATSGADVELQRRIKAIVIKSAPSNVYYCIKGQLPIWLATAFGAATAVAQLGALSRLMIGLTVITTVVTTVLVPRFARIPRTSPFIQVRFWQVLIAAAAVFAAVLLLAICEPRPFMLLLGPKYESLRLELVLALAGGALLQLAAVVSWLYMAQGHVMNAVRNISVHLVATVIAVRMFDLTSVRGLLEFGLAVGIVEFANVLSFAVVALRRGDRRSGTS